MRRILRIWPVYFITVAVGFFIIPWLLRHVPPEMLPFEIQIPLGKIWWYIGFAVNFELVRQFINQIILTVLWSVSVEEQYYLFWPLFNKFVTKRLYPLLLLALLVTSFLFRWFWYLDKTFVRFGTVSVMNDLVIGSTIGYAAFHYKQVRDFFAGLSRRTIATVYILFLVALPLRGFIYYFSEQVDQILVSLHPVIFSLIFAFIILEQNYATRSLFKVSRFRPLSYLGEISYGLYCYHMIFILLTSLSFRYIFGEITRTSITLFIAQFVVTFALTVLFSHWSFRTIERFFLRRKHRFQPGN